MHVYLTQLRSRESPSNRDDQNKDKSGRHDEMTSRWLQKVMGQFPLVMTTVSWILNWKLRVSEEWSFGGLLIWVFISGTLIVHSDIGFIRVPRNFLQVLDAVQKIEQRT